MYFPLWLWGLLVFALIINGGGDTRQFTLVDTYPSLAKRKPVVPFAAFSVVMQSAGRWPPLPWHVNCATGPLVDTVNTLDGANVEVDYGQLVAEDAFGKWRWFPTVDGFALSHLGGLREGKSRTSRSLKVG